MSTFWIPTGIIGQTWKAAFRSDVSLWNGSAFAAYNGTTWGLGTYFTTMTEGRPGEYSCTIPAGVLAVAGAVCEAYYGSSPATSAVPVYTATLTDVGVNNVLKVVQAGARR